MPFSFSFYCAFISATQFCSKHCFFRYTVLSFSIILWSTVTCFSDLNISSQITLSCASLYNIIFKFVERKTLLHLCTSISVSPTWRRIYQTSSEGHWTSSVFRPQTHSCGSLPWVKLCNCKEPHSFLWQVAIGLGNYTLATPLPFLYEVLKYAWGQRVTWFS